MNGLFWLGSMGEGQDNTRLTRDVHSNQEKTLTVQRELEDLKRRVERQSLLNQALWEIVRERLGMTDSDLEQRATEIDLRDGVQDGAITAVPVTCSACGRTSSSRKTHCMYCSHPLR